MGRRNLRGNDINSQKWTLLDQLHLELGLKPNARAPRPVDRKGAFVPLTDFQKMFAPSLARAALLARDVGFPIVDSDDGSGELVDVAPLKRIVQIISQIRQLGPEQGFSRAQAARDQRDALMNRLVDAGLRYEYSGLKRGALLVFYRPDGSRVTVLTYIAPSQAASKKVTFGVSHLSDDEVDWIVLVSPALGRAFAKTRAELQAAYGKDAQSVGLTFRPTSSTDDDLERRIEEIVTGHVRQRPLPRRPAESKRSTQQTARQDLRRRAQKKGKKRLAQ